MKERWSHFTASCWRFFGVGSFWPIFFALVFVGFQFINIKYHYTQDDIDELQSEIDEIQIEHESEIEAAREDSYQSGYCDAESDYLEWSADGYSEGFLDGYYYGYIDSASGKMCDPSSHY